MAEQVRKLDRLPVVIDPEHLAIVHAGWRDGYPQIQPEGDDYFSVPGCRHTDISVNTRPPQNFVQARKQKSGLLPKRRRYKTSAPMLMPDRSSSATIFRSAGPAAWKRISSTETNDGRSMQTNPF